RTGPNHRGNLVKTTSDVDWTKSDRHKRLHVLLKSNSSRRNLCRRQSSSGQSRTLTSVPSVTLTMVKPPSPLLSPRYWPLSTLNTTNSATMPTLTVLLKSASAVLLSTFPTLSTQPKHGTAHTLTPQVTPTTSRT